MMVKSKKLLQRLVLFGSVFLTDSLLGAVHFSLNGSSNNSSVFLQSTKTLSGSVSINFDVFDHLQLGVSHHQSKSTEKGYTYDKAEEVYFYTETTTMTKANSLDITIILYYGTIFTPFLKAGLITKEYTVIYGTDPATQKKETFPAPPSAHGGVGLSIKMNEKFSLNLNHSVSTGYKQETPASELKQVLDSTSSFGISYKI